MKILIRTFDPSLARTLSESAPAGISIERPSVIGRKGLGYEAACEVVVFVADAGKDVAVGLLASWLYDHLKRAPVQSVEIDGQKVGVSEAEIKSVIEMKVAHRF